MIQFREAFIQTSSEGYNFWFDSFVVGSQGIKLIDSTKVSAGLVFEQFISFESKDIIKVFLYNLTYQMQEYLCEIIRPWNHISFVSQDKTCLSILFSKK